MIAGITVAIGGTERVVPPLNFRALVELKDKLAGFKPGAMDFDSIELVLECAHRALLRNYPDITREELTEHLDVGNMMDVMQAVMDVSGLKRKQIEADLAGGGAQPGEAKTSSGGQI